MKKSFIVICLVISSSWLFGQASYLQDISETKALSKEVTELFSENKISKSFKELTPYWPIPQNEIASVKEKTIKYLNLIDERFGMAIGIVKVNNETINDIALRETYLIRYKNTAIRLIFTYYRNNNGWIVNSFKWDDSFKEEFK